VVWCQDWPVVASGLPVETPIAVMEANRVVACSAAARASGVTRGLRRREAQARCPSLEIVASDPGRDARVFEPVLSAVEAFTPTVEVERPGVVTLATRGPSRYFGGDRDLAIKMARAVDAALLGVAGGAPACQIGVADGRFAALQAARRAPAGPDGSQVMIVAPGESGSFVATFGVSVLPFDELAERLGRLGIKTLGDLAALPAASMLGRFGLEGAVAHRLARGLDDRPLAARTPPLDLAVSVELDPPVERVEAAAFMAKALADELHAGLAAAGLACTRVAIEAETEHGETLTRLWRHDGALDAAAMAARARWQLDGWLSREEITGGLTRLQLTPDEVKPDVGRQLGFWGGSTGHDGIARTLARLQGILGPDEVVTAVVGGGRDPAAQVKLVPWGDERTPARAGTPGLGDLPAGSQSRTGGQSRTRPVEVPPWPGRLPGPAPAVVHSPPLVAEVRDRGGRPVTVSARATVSDPPAEISVAGGSWQPIEGWAGPWPVEERWWEGGRRRARLQVATTEGVAYLLARESGSWWVEATYD
jgi:protein ImuB